MRIILLTLTVSFLVLGVLVGCTDNNVELNRDEWECTKTANIPITTHMFVGKVLVPMTRIQKMCVQYTRT